MKYLYVSVRTADKFLSLAKIQHGGFVTRALNNRLVSNQRLEMTIYNLYIFDRNGTCLYYESWNRRKESNLSKDEEFKLMYGMLYSIKSFVARMSPAESKEGFLNYRTSKYKLHFYETPTGLKFILNTDLNVGSTKDVLFNIYSKIYVEYVVKNPLCRLDEPIQSELFASKLDTFIRSLPIYN